jgi:hypothetical protein
MGKSMLCDGTGPILSFASDGDFSHVLRDVLEQLDPLEPSPS